MENEKKEKELVEDLMDVGIWEQSYSLPIVKKQPIAQSKDANRNIVVIGKYKMEKKEL
ncbi:MULTISPECIES: hypothetical protein [Bacillus cereus group]|uniref:hypothetical protein n=1 Tax=Bacillus cereus group TaxID=86661 RepID=UPI000B218995|nr:MULTISPECIES: hypothetical protein [Bacillus cereus group]MCU5110658.1 hypothetical protein [Bacillus wiedmannii]MCU5150592.1 hypothetical protein [Bacillus wiedmannii]MCU5410947.1 hypothetical protein [Bacillus wiedmannii]